MELKEAVDFCRHEYRKYPDIFTDDIGLDITDPITKTHAIKTWKDKRKVTLDITSWVGVSWNAIHNYGKLVIQGVNMVYDDKPDTITIIDENKYPLGCYKYELKIFRPLTKEELDEEPDRWEGFIEGDHVNGFEQMMDLVEYAKEIIRLRFVGDWEFEIIYPFGRIEKINYNLLNY